ncbi:MAG TPA: MbnP family protein [Rariglobus sp.]|jgi:cytochrome c peroxidase|nr:MbnP family protein [Rariglobus sp.]
MAGHSLRSVTISTSRILAGIVFCLMAANVRAADVTLIWKPVAGAAPVKPASSEFMKVGANELSFTRIAALVSSVAFVRPDGSFAQLEGQFGALALDEGRSHFTLHGVPTGRYIGFEFLVGLRPDVNHGDPGRWPAGHALNPLVDGLHWSWQGGYIFLALEGNYRRPGGETGGWSLHLANDPRLTLIELPHPMEITGDTTITLELDLSRVLDGITLSPEHGDSTHSRKGDKLADHLVENVPSSFRVVAVAATIPVAGVTPAVSVKSAGTPLAFTVPPGFPQVTLPADNPLTVEGVALGRRLFSDTRLSRTGVQSCATCHQPARAFSDSVALSLGADGKPGARNAMPLFNLAWSGAYAWDGGKPHIRDQVLAAMTNDMEMHADPATVVAALAKDEALGDAFQSAFASREITVARIGLALEQYLLTLVSADSRFDRAMRGETQLTEDEKQGFAIFSTEYDPVHGMRGGDCFHCHGGVLFSDYAYKNTGLDLVSADQGRAKVTGNAFDRGKFKTPSLRNVALTAPYMHDGRFMTLEQVIAHYDHGVKRSDNLDPNIGKHPDAGLQLSADEQRQLVAFLKTLTDARYDAGGPSK